MSCSVVITVYLLYVKINPFRPRPVRQPSQSFPFSVKIFLADPPFLRGRGGGRQGARGCRWPWHSTAQYCRTQYFKNTFRFTLLRSDITFRATRTLAVSKIILRYAINSPAYCMKVKVKVMLSLCVPLSFIGGWGWRYNSMH